MTPIVIEFVMDDAYHSEFHREWVAALGPGWRAQTRLAVACAAVAVALGALSWALRSGQIMLGAVVAFAVAGVIAVLLARRRMRWFACVRRLPWFGKLMRIEVRNGDLVQVKSFPGDPRYQRTGAIVMTPNGYLVKYRGMGDSPDPAVSATEASVYLPHRLITPPMTRQAFLGAVSAANREDDHE